MDSNPIKVQFVHEIRVGRVHLILCACPESSSEGVPVLAMAVSMIA
jgi:hypothetical protein